MRFIPAASLSLLFLISTFLLASSFLPNYAFVNRRIALKSRGHQTFIRSTTTPETTPETSEGEKQKEEEITSPQIKSLRKKILDTEALIKSISADTDKINQEIKQLDIQYGDQIDTINQDFARLKQRSHQEAKEVNFRAKADAIKEVLPITDSFFKYKELYAKLQSPNEKKIAHAYEELFDSIEDIIHYFGAKRLSALGQPFNVDNMDAIMTAPSTEYKSGVVCNEFQFGYEIDGRCIRPAMVAVSEGPGPAAEAPST